MSNSYYKVTPEALAQKNYRQTISEAFSGGVNWYSPVLFQSSVEPQQSSLFQKVYNYDPDYVGSHLYIWKSGATADEISTALGDQFRAGTLNQDKYRHQMWHFTAATPQVAKQLVSQGIQLNSARVSIREFVPKSTLGMNCNYLRSLVGDSSFRDYCSTHLGWARIQTLCETYPWLKKHRVKPADLVSAIQALSKEGFRLNKNHEMFRPPALKKSSVWQEREPAVKPKVKADKPNADKPKAVKPKVNANKPKAVKPKAVKPKVKADKPKAVKPKADKPKAVKPKAVKPKVKADKPKVKADKTVQSKAVKPKKS